MRRRIQIVHVSDEFAIGHTSDGICGFFGRRRHLGVVHHLSLMQRLYRSGLIRFVQQLLELVPVAQYRPHPGHAAHAGHDALCYPVGDLHLVEH